MTTKNTTSSINKYLNANTVLIPLIGFLIWNKVETIEKDISDIKTDIRELRSGKMSSNSVIDNKEKELADLKLKTFAILPATWDDYRKKQQP